DLEELGVTHMTVNHNECFVDPEMGAHTNTIEGTWGGVKLK
ncbi:10681_t:CDS:1, partial [Acaulospora colombiana]